MIRCLDCEGQNLYEFINMLSKKYGGHGPHGESAYDEDTCSKLLEGETCSGKLTSSLTEFHITR